MMILPKVACCIPVLSSRYIGKCAAPVLKRSADTDDDSGLAADVDSGTLIHSHGTL